MRDTMYYLAITGLTECWDAQFPLLLLGPWCRPGNQSVLDETGKWAQLDTPFMPGSGIKAAFDFCETQYEKTMPLLTNALNTLHQTDYPEYYWRVVVGPWVGLFIHVLYDRYCRVRKAMEYDFVTHTAEAAPYPTADYTDFLNSITVDHQHNQALITNILLHICPERVVVSHEKQKAVHSSVSTADLWQNQQSWLSRLLLRCSRGRVLISEMHHLDKKSAMMLMLSGSTVYVPLTYRSNPALRGGYSQSMRRSMRLPGGNSEFEQVLFQLIPQELPVSYIEYYRHFQSQAREDAPASMSALGSAIGWMGNERIKFLGAEAAIQGCSLLEFQYGGNFGFTDAMPYENLAFAKSRFYTWGWEKAGKNTKPLPSPYLSKINTTEQKPGVDELLLVGTAFPVYAIRFSSHLMPDDMPDYLEDKVTFIQQLRSEIQKSIAYRGYHELGWDERAFISSRTRGLRFRDEGKLTDHMRSARLLIIDHPHTSFLEALVMNRPLVMYWNHDIYQMRDEAEPFFDLLRNAGIVHRSPIEAAEKVNQIWGNVSGWWNSAEVQQARKIFSNQFALHDKDWRKSWIQEMDSFLR